MRDLPWFVGTSGFVYDTVTPKLMVTLQPEKFITYAISLPVGSLNLDKKDTILESFQKRFPQGLSKFMLMMLLRKAISLKKGKLAVTSMNFLIDLKLSDLEDEQKFPKGFVKDKERFVDFISRLMEGKLFYFT